MMYEYSFYSNLERLQRMLQEQNERLDEMEKELLSLKQKYNERKTPIHIEKVEYRFDQLKVETLEGTLNIGFTPQESGSSIDEVSIGDQGKDGDYKLQGPVQTELYNRLRLRMHQFLDEEALDVVRGLEDDYNTVLGQTYREQLIFDLRKQVDKRIGYYLNHHSITPDNLNEVEQEIYEQTKTDVLEALERHLKQIKGGAS